MNLYPKVHNSTFLAKIFQFQDLEASGDSDAPSSIDKDEKSIRIPYMKPSKQVCLNNQKALKFDRNINDSFSVFIIH